MGTSVGPRVGLFGSLRRFLLGGDVPRWGGGFGGIVGATDVDVSPISDRTELLERYAGWVFVCAELISSDVRAARWRLVDSRGREVVNRRAERFLREPGAGLLWEDLIELSDKHLSVAGECFWRLLRGGGGVTGVSVIYPHWVREPWFRDGFFVGWVVEVPGRAREFVAREDVIRVHFPHPLSPFMAASPVVAVAASHYFDLYLRAYGMSVLRNDGGVPTGLLTTDVPLTVDEAEAYKEVWRQRYSQQRELAVMGQGLKYQQLGINIKDLKFADAAAFSKDQVLAAFRVPPAVFGDVSDANRSNMSGAMETYQRQALRPRLLRYESVINAWLLPLVAPGVRIVFDDVVKADRAADVLEAEAGARWGTITLNEFRAYLGFEGVPGGDVLLPGQMAEHNPGSPGGEVGLSNPGGDDGEDERALRARLRGVFSAWRTEWVATGRVRVADLVRASTAFTPAEFMRALEVVGWSGGVSEEFFEALKGPVARELAGLVSRRES